MDPVMLRGFRDELSTPMLKQALLEHVVRLGATDVEHLPVLNKVFSNTPRLAMPHRTPEQLGQLQHDVAQWFAKKEQPIIDAMHRKIDANVKFNIPVPFVREHKRISLPMGRSVVIPPNFPAASPLKHMSEMVVRNPETLPVELAGAALPGITPINMAYVGAKRALERLIDKHIPVPMPKG